MLNLVNEQIYNADRPLVIGKAKNPRCFKNFTLSVDYDFPTKAWMTSTIFQNWFHRTFVPQVKKYLKLKGPPAKAILLLDNAPSHSPAENLRSEDGNVFAIYMPPNVTPLIQPMDQNVIRITKLYYRSCLLSSIVASKSEDLSKLLKDLTIKDPIVNLSLAWNRLEAETIKKCWKNLLNFTQNIDEDPEEDIPLSILNEKYKNEADEQVEEVVTLLKEVNSQVDFSREDIEKWNEEQELVNDQDIDSDNEVEESNDQEDHVEVLRKCRDKALQKNLAAKKVQQHITQYLNRM